MNIFKTASFSAFMLFCLASFCEDSQAPSAPAAKEFRIIASFYPVYIHTLNVAGGIPGVTVRNMTSPDTGCLHDYQLSTDDMKAISEADVFIINGAGMESFLEKVLKEKKALRVIDSSKNISLIKESTDSGISTSIWGSGGDKEINGHIWLGVGNSIKQVENISAELMKADPARAEAYRKNAIAYLDKLEALKKEMREELRNIKSRKIVTFHNAFPYLARECDLEIVATIQAEPGSEPSAEEMANTVRKIWKSGAKAIFAEPQYPAKTASTITRETGSQLYILDPAVSGPEEAGAYIDIMKKNMEVLKKALK